MEFLKGQLKIEVAVFEREKKKKNTRAKRAREIVSFSSLKDEQTVLETL